MPIDMRADSYRANQRKRIASGKSRHTYHSSYVRAHPDSEAAKNIESGMPQTVVAGKDSKNKAQRTNYDEFVDARQRRSGSLLQSGTGLHVVTLGQGSDARSIKASSGVVELMERQMRSGEYDRALRDEKEPTPFYIGRPYQPQSYDPRAQERVSRELDPGESIRFVTHGAMGKGGKNGTGNDGMDSNLHFSNYSGLGMAQDPAEKTGIKGTSKTIKSQVTSKGFWKDTGKAALDIGASAGRGGVKYAKDVATRPYRTAKSFIDSPYKTAKKEVVGAFVPPLRAVSNVKKDVGIISKDKDVAAYSIVSGFAVGGSVLSATAPKAAAWLGRGFVTKAGYDYAKTPTPQTMAGLGLVSVGAIAGSASSVAARLKPAPRTRILEVERAAGDIKIYRQTEVKKGKSGYYQETRTITDIPVSTRTIKTTTPERYKPMKNLLFKGRSSESRMLSTQAIHNIKSETAGKFNMNTNLAKYSKRDVKESNIVVSDKSIELSLPKVSKQNFFDKVGWKVKPYSRKVSESAGLQVFTTVKPHSRSRTDTYNSAFLSSVVSKKLRGRQEPGIRRVEVFDGYLTKRKYTRQGTQSKDIVPKSSSIFSATDRNTGSNIIIDTKTKQGILLQRQVTNNMFADVATKPVVRVRDVTPSRPASEGMLTSIFKSARADKRVGPQRLRGRTTVSPPKTRTQSFTGTARMSAIGTGTMVSPDVRLGTDSRMDQLRDLASLRNIRTRDITRTDSRTRARTIIKVGTLTAQAQMPRQMQMTETIPKKPKRPTRTMPGTGRPKMPFKIPDFQFKTKEKSAPRMLGSVDFAPKYAASIEAVMFNVKGKKPGKQQIATGLSLRPMLR